MSDDYFCTDYSHDDRSALRFSMNAGCRSKEPSVVRLADEDSNIQDFES
jgi:hypothetical protein